MYGEMIGEVVVARVTSGSTRRPVSSALREEDGADLLVAHLRARLRLKLKRHSRVPPKFWLISFWIAARSEPPCQRDSGVWASGDELVARSATETGPALSTASDPMAAPRSLIAKPPVFPANSRLPSRLSTKLVTAPRGDDE